MTTNSFGGALPRFDYPTIQPAVARASRGMPLTTRFMAVAAAAGLAYYATSQTSGRESQGQANPSPRSFASSHYENNAAQPPSYSRMTDTIRLRRE